jgi:hypothetical protein
VKMILKSTMPVQSTAWAKNVFGECSLCWQEMGQTSWGFGIRHWSSCWTRGEDASIMRFY